MPNPRSYQDIAAEMADPRKADACLNKQIVLDRMIGALPAAPWADVEILDWMPDDDRLAVEYSFADTPFGRVLVANTPLGVCYLGLAENGTGAVLADFHKRFGHAIRVEVQTPQQKQTLDFLAGKCDGRLTFHLRGTPHQTEIWRRLIRIPRGKVVSYATLGGGPQQARAAGTANGRNPIFWIVPCHRVVQTTGSFDRYFWGEDVKRRLLAWEFAEGED